MILGMQGYGILKVIGAGVHGNFFGRLQTVKRPGILGCFSLLEGNIVYNFRFFFGILGMS